MGEITSVHVYLVDGRSIWRLGLIRALEEGPSLNVVGEAKDCAQANQDDRYCTCDVLITSWPPQDLEWADPPDLSRRPTLALIRQGSKAVAGVTALKAGAAACLYDDVGPGELRAAVRFVYEGGLVVDPRLVAAVSEHMDGLDKRSPTLTEVEAKVAVCIAKGRTNREIASDTGLAERAVVTIISALLQKLRVPTRSAVAAWWIRQGGEANI